MNAENILMKIRENKEIFKKLGLIKIGLFGSYARGENEDGSDVDLIIEFTEGQKSFHNYMEACDFLEKIINTKVDVLTAEAISPYIKPYIDKEVIYERL